MEVRGGYVDPPVLHGLSVLGMRSFQRPRTVEDGWQHARRPRWATTNTAAGRSSVKPPTTLWSASKPPAEAPIATMSCPVIGGLSTEYPAIHATPRCSSPIQHG